ncbi:MAG: ribosomal L7Ae/L30e/S12e/Gadd45 family protein [Faecousia sp.]
MDTKKKSKIPKCGNVPDLTGVRTVVGAKQLKKAVNAGRARYVFLAENADPAVTEPLALLCQSHQIQTAWVRTMAELGRACGIEVGAAAAAVVD